MKQLSRGIRAASAVALLAGLGVACHQKAEAPDPFGSLTVDQVESMVQAKSVSVFDNNQETRFKQSHVPSAKWLAFNAVTADALGADKGRALVFYCANTH